MAIYCLVLAPSTLGFCAVSRPVLVRSLTAAHFRTTGSIAAAAPASERPPYVLTGLPRPQWRGRMMGWAHSTKAWYVLALAYVLAAWRLPSPTPLGAGGLALRVVAAAASSANIRISDGYHNADERAAAGVSDALAPQTETFWLRWDYVGISSVLTSLLWLWSSNFGWVGQLRAVAIAGGVSTALVALISATVVPRKVGHTSVKLIMAVQFVALLGYLCVKCVTSCPANCSERALAFSRTARVQVDCAHELALIRAVPLLLPQCTTQASFGSTRRGSSCTCSRSPSRPPLASTRCSIPPCSPVTSPRWLSTCATLPCPAREASAASEGSSEKRTRGANRACRCAIQMGGICDL